MGRIPVEVSYQHKFHGQKLIDGVKINIDKDGESINLSYESGGVVVTDTDVDLGNCCLYYAEYSNNGRMQSIRKVGANYLMKQLPSNAKLFIMDKQSFVPVVLN